jgi:outer membrane protein assembly factor BamB
MKRLVPAILLLLGSTLGAVILKSWVAVEPSRPVVPRLAGPQVDPLPVIAPTEHCNRVLVKTERIHPDPPPRPEPLVGSWPGFRGAARDNIAKDNVPLANAWSAAGPPRLWEIALGDGHAGAAVYGGRVYVLDYDEQQRRDCLRCFALDTGTEIWRSSYPIDVKRNHGMSRTVPAVNDRFVITVGPMCQVMCVERATGAFVWGMDLERDYGTTVPLWYTAQCPLLDGDTVVLAPAGKDLLMGVDCATGKILWRTPNPQKWDMSHASIMPMPFAGQSTYVYAAIGGMVCVAAAGEQAGQVLWESTAWDKRIVAPCPVQISPTELFMTSGHGAGSAILDIAADGRSVAGVRIVDKAELACEQQTPVLVQGYLFGVLPKDAGQYREQLVCWDPQRGVVWRSGPERRFGLGPWVLGDSKIYIMDDRGTLTMAEATPQAYRELGRARILDGRDAWGPMALAGRRLILRDSTRMVCLDVGQDE